MRVYVLINAWTSSDTMVEGICYGLYSTFEKAKEAMKRGVEKTKEGCLEWIKDEDEIEITEKEEDSCTLEAHEGERFEIFIFKIEENELDGLLTTKEQRL